MGKRTKEELERQKLYYEMAQYVYEHAGILFQAQADRLGYTNGKFQALRTDDRRTVSENHIEYFQEVFREELAGFGEPSPVDQELARLREELERLKEKVGKKESLNEALQEMLIEAQKKLKELGG